MTDFTRRDTIKLGAATALVAGTAGLIGSAGARAQTELSFKPEDGAELRVLRWKRFVQGDEDAWNANTQKFTEATGVPVRIDAQIRTLGFGGPDQGVLVYDTIGGPELGVLVRATPSWQTVRLYRQTTSGNEVQVSFEAIGAGEVMIDDVQIHAWEPAAAKPMPIRRIAETPR